MAHTRVAAPSSCLPAHSHHCGRQTLPTPFTHTTPARAQTRIVHTQHTIHKSEESANQDCVHATPNSQITKDTRTHTQRNTQEVVGRSEEFKRGWESGYYQGIVDANGAQDRSEPDQTQAQGMLFVSRKYKSTTLLISLSLSLSRSLW
jgi:hypothetical protein